ncbi:MAG: family 78 glycoside hydrolase catalytic domain [Muribaculaceae bacterium]|nr:family 78 glycoside hydrolase catalytic domain [Muribaculaceae bacterium]
MNILKTAVLLAAICCSQIVVANNNSSEKSSNSQNKKFNEFFVCEGLVEPLDDSTWECSQWISVKNAPVVEGRIEDGSRAADGANWFISEMKNDGRVVSAIWMTTALGVYDIYVNGKLIGEEVLKPGFTHPTKTRRSFTYDVTDAIKKGKGDVNSLAAQVTPGWWADKIVTPGGHNGMLGRKCAFRGVLQLTFADGSVKTFGTNTSEWRAAIAGRVLHSAIFDGEIYDSREAPGYASDANFEEPEVNSEFNGEILPTDGAEVYMRCDLALEPVEMYVWQETEGATADAFGKVVVKRRYQSGEPIRLSPGETLVVDFGQNCAAVPSFRFKAASGTRLRCEVAEMLNDGNGLRSRGMDGPEGSAHRQNLRIPSQGMWLEYIFDGSKKFADYTPRRTFFGYRYVSITADADVEIASIASVPVTSISEKLETGSITTGNDLINRLISNTVWGERSNYLSVPTDCPQRNERLGWTADTQVFTETGSFFADTKKFFHKWLRDLRDSQGNSGGFPGVAPLSQYGGEMSRLGWSDAGVIVPWTIWKQFGDTAVVNASWDSMTKYLKLLDSTCFNHQALLADNGNYQWADWLSYEPLESCSGRAFGPNGPKPETLDYWNYLSASYWAMDAGMMADMAAATGRTAEAERYAAMQERARNYIKQTFLNEDGRFKTEILNSMQTPALFALKNDIVDGAARTAMIQRLRENFASHNNCLQTGFLGTSILMSTLTDNGMADIAYELLFQRNNPSWLYSVDNGATTIWERWNSYMIDSGMGPQGMNSFNHYAYGCVCEWLWETAAGIAADPASPGFKNIIMAPVPDRRLGHLDAEYQSAAGLIKSSWRYEGDLWHWTFTIPEGATATVTLPGSTTPFNLPSGTHTLSRPLP